MRYALGFSARKLVYLRQFVGAMVWPLPGPWALRPGDELYVWGRRATGFDLPAEVTLWRVEDGFLRSVGLGAGLAAPCSWVFDRQSPHYDPTRASELEVILQFGNIPVEVVERAAHLIERIVAARLSKYNVGRGAWKRRSDRHTLLVVGQVEGDAALRAGACGSVRSNMDLLRTVRTAYPGAHLIYRPHPDVMAGLREGNDLNAVAIADEVVVHAPITDLIEQVDAVHVMTSLAGFEALLRGRRVVCHGQPFYSGWGLTEDRAPVARRTRKRTLEELVAAALILYPRYVDPFTRKPCSVEQVVDGLQALVWRGPTWTDQMREVLARRLLRAGA